jgi:hypothetical protein
MILIITVKMPKWGPGLIAYGVHVTHLFQRRELVCPVLGHMASTVALSMPPRRYERPDGFREGHRSALITSSG